jgi:hypothetical protein
VTDPICPECCDKGECQDPFGSPGELVPCPFCNAPESPVLVRLSDAFLGASRVAADGARSAPGQYARGYLRGQADTFREVARLLAGA